VSIPSKRKGQDHCQSRCPDQPLPPTISRHASLLVITSHEAEGSAAGCGHAIDDA
jgi:hypothetical protein